MINQIILKNWKTHLDSNISFSNGTNVIIGNIGTGKTSILDSICFALFGTFPTLQSKKIKLDNVIMKRPVEKNKAEVQLNFTINNKNYTVKRVIEKGKGVTYAEIREDNKLLEVNTSRVTEIVEKILKTNYETFSKAIYSEQNNLDYFLTLPKGQRIKKIDELLMIEKFESARANCVTVYNKLNDKKFALQSVIDQVKIENLEKSLNELKESIENLKLEKENIIKNLEHIVNEKVKLDKEIKELNVISKSIEELEKEKIKLSALLTEISNVVLSLEKELSGQKPVDFEYIKDIKIKVSDLELQVKDLSLKREKLLTNLADNKSKKISLEEDLVEISKEIEDRLKSKKELKIYKKEIGDDIEREVEEKNNLFRKSVSEAESVKNRIKDLNLSIEQLSKSGSKCPVCEKRLTEDVKEMLIKDKKKEVKMLTEHLSNLEKQIASIEKEIKNLNLTYRKVQKLEIDVENLYKLEKQKEEKMENLKKVNEAIEIDTKVIKDIEEKLDKLKKELEESREEKDKAELLNIRFQELSENRRKQLEIKNRLENVLSRLSLEERKLEGKNLDLLKGKFNELLIKEREYKTKLDSIEDRLKEKVESYENLNKQIENWKVMKEKIKKLEKIILDFKLFEKAIESTQTELRKQFIETVNYTMNQLWSTLYPYGDFTEIRLFIEEGDYVLKLLSRSGIWDNVEGIASGGERSIACLALRIALALTLAPHLRILILDEPSVNLDVKSLSELATTLRERVYEFMDQVILITHEEELQEAVTGRAYKLERDKTNDGVTKVIQIY
jgi:exonuclease SbcC